jgi:hypothetical protein
MSQEEPHRLLFALEREMMAQSYVVSLTEQVASACEKCFLLNKGFQFAVFLENEEKMSPKVLFKKIPFQRCPVKEQYLERWKIFRTFSVLDKQTTKP